MSKPIIIEWLFTAYSKEEREAFFEPPSSNTWVHGQWDPVKNGLSFREWTIQSVRSYNIQDADYAGLHSPYKSWRQAMIRWWNKVHPIVPSIIDNSPPSTQVDQSMVRAQAALEMAMSQPRSDDVEMEDDLDKDAEGEDFDMDAEGDGMELAKSPSIAMKDKGKEKAMETRIEGTGIPFFHLLA